jgi:hypothetical protein
MLRHRALSDVPVVTSADLAALGASLLTAGGSIGALAFQERLRRRKGDRDALSAAVTAMLSLSMALMLRARAAGLQMRGSAADDRCG